MQAVSAVIDRRQAGWAVAHDLYHAGEINHLRALLRGTDRWPYD
jgi:hypothetical protein